MSQETILAAPEGACIVTTRGSPAFPSEGAKSSVEKWIFAPEARVSSISETGDIVAAPDTEASVVAHTGAPKIPRLPKTATIAGNAKCLTFILFYIARRPSLHE